MQDHSVDLYMEEAKKHESTGSIEMKLYTELSQLPQNRNAQVDSVSLASSAANEVKSVIANQAQKKVRRHNKPSSQITITEDMLLGTNFLLAGIMFLLFLMICFQH